MPSLSECNASRRRSPAPRGDGINLTQIQDQLDPARNETYSYGPANRLRGGEGPWGSVIYETNGSGNRTARERTTAGATTQEVFNYVPGSNRLAGFTLTGSADRAFTYDGSGNQVTSERGGLTNVYTYNYAGRLSHVTINGSVRGPYVYNAFGQLASRQVTDDPASTVHMIWDRDGNLIAEADAATGVTKREYIWLGSRPVAVVDDVDTSPVLYHVHVDHLDRPVLMTNSVGNVVWRASYLPFGEVHSTTGPASLDARFPGQWFMAETALSYNWHRWYNSNLGRYTQPDPLGLEAGANRYAYALNSPLMYTDPTGLIHEKLGDLWDWINPYRREDPGACPIPDENRDQCSRLYLLCDAQRWGGDWFCDDCLQYCIAQGEWPFEHCNMNLPQSRPDRKFPPKTRWR